jgi:AcrR family transcriptional regulator
MRDQILEKSSHMFITLGFKSVTMDDIAAEMAISKKTIYQYFKNKDELVHDASLFVYEKISTGIDCICSLGKNAVEELIDIKDFVNQYLQDEKNAALYQLSKFYPKTFKFIRKKEFEKMQECVVRNIRNGIIQGLYRKEVNLSFMTRIYFQGVFSIKDIDVFPLDEFESKSLQDLYLDYHLRAMVTIKGLKLLEKHINFKINS